MVFRDGTAPPEQTINVDIPAAGVASMQYPGGPHLELVQLKKDVRGGSFMPVTFRFAKAGAVSVETYSCRDSATRSFHRCHLRPARRARPREPIR